MKRYSKVFAPSLEMRSPAAFADPPEVDFWISVKSRRTAVLTCRNQIVHDDYSLTRFD